MQLFVMNTELKSIILSYNLSKNMNTEIPNLDLLLAENVSTPLRNACLSWSHVLKYTAYSEEVAAALSQFFYEKLLTWTEVMSLIGEYDAIGPMLRQAVSYVKVGS